MLQSRRGWLHIGHQPTWNSDDMCSRVPSPPKDTTKSTCSSLSSQSNSSTWQRQEATTAWEQSAWQILKITCKTSVHVLGRINNSTLAGLNKHSHYSIDSRSLTTTPGTQPLLCLSKQKVVAYIHFQENITLDHDIQIFLLKYSSVINEGFRTRENERKSYCADKWGL